jgi:hypothetical protein
LNQPKIMTYDPLSLEATLRDLQATTLDEAFLTRLEAAADETLIQLSREEIRFEEILREMKPTELTSDFMAKLEKVVHEIPFAVSEKIVLFPRASRSPSTPNSRPMWAAAAAVALIGGITALMIPAHKPSPSVANITTKDPAIATNTASQNFVPASFNSGISEVHDEGIVWNTKAQPHSVVRMVYKDLITLKDKIGRTFQVEQPRIEYILVPANTD